MAPLAPTPEVQLRITQLMGQLAQIDKTRDDVARELRKLIYNSPKR